MGFGPGAILSLADAIAKETDEEYLKNRYQVISYFRRLAEQITSLEDEIARLELKDAVEDSVTTGVAYG